MKVFLIRAIILIAWGGSLFAAFQFGKKTDASISSDQSKVPEPSKTVTFDPHEKSMTNIFRSGGDSNSSAAGMVSGESKGGVERRNVPDMIASMKSRLRFKGGMMFNATAMMKIMAPIADLSEEQLLEALAEVEKTVPAQQQKMMFYQLLLGRLAEVDGEGAMEYVAEKFSDRTGMVAGMAMSVMGTWAQNDPDAAWNWFVKNRDEQDPGPMRDNQVQFIFSGLAARDLGNAFRRLDQLSDSEKNRAVSGIAMSASWNPDSRDEVLSLAKDLPSEQKHLIYQRMFSQWAMSTPLEAIEWARELPEEDRKKVVKQGGFSLMYSNPEIGAEFMLENSSEAELPGTYSMIASRWASRDPNAAGEWLNGLPQGPHLDGARSSFARVISSRDPISAMEWAKAVDTEKSRTQAVRQVYTQWHRKNPRDADSALDSSGIGEAEIATIREAVSKSTVVKRTIR